MRFAFIAAEKVFYPITILCRVMGVSTSGFYAWLNRSPSTRAQRDQELTKKIVTFYKTSGGKYGSPRIHTDLLADSERVGKKRVERLMRQSGIKGKRTRKFRCTTNSKHSKHVAPNPAYRAMNYRVTTAGVDSANYHVTGARLKQQGMRWSREGASEMAALRAALFFLALLTMAVSSRCKHPEIPSGTDETATPFLS